MNRLGDFPDADLATWFTAIEAAQGDARASAPSDALKALLETDAAGPLLARPSLREQRHLPH